MDVFDLRRRLVSDYRSYTRSFIKIRDSRIDGFVDGILGAEGFWPEPLLQLNPTFRPGGTIDDLVELGMLHRDCSDIFRIGKSDSDHRGKQLLLHQHQREAILKAREGRSYVLTTGTGSGKSLAYIVPIVDHVLRRGTGHGIQTIVVYPMNALANSQSEELGKFIDRGYPEGRPPVRFARYTGQERGETREAIRSESPDILLTNYMMLELLLTRSEDRELVRAARGLRFLVFDELHTYRGRQGADVAMLIRRCRHAFGNDVICVGTSATMASGGGSDNRRLEVAKVSQSLFGVDFTGTPRALRQAIGSDEPFTGRFDLPLPDGETYLGRTSPVVEGLASWTLDQALDPESRDAAPVASRCGVIATSAVAERTTLLVARFRYHLRIGGARHRSGGAGRATGDSADFGGTGRGAATSGRDTLLCEEIVPLACTGAAETPRWLSREKSEHLLTARPERNLLPTALEQQLQLMLPALPKLRSSLESVAKERAEAQLAAHERVRAAARAKGRIAIEPVLPVDLLGVYVLLPRLT